jgi:hypothetical protein
MVAAEDAVVHPRLAAQHLRLPFDEQLERHHADIASRQLMVEGERQAARTDIQVRPILGGMPSITTTALERTILRAPDL